MIPAQATNISVFIDGNEYCAVFTDHFTNIAESSAGFGNTQLEAIDDLYENAGLK